MLQEMFGILLAIPNNFPVARRCFCSKVPSSHRPPEILRGDSSVRWRCETLQSGWVKSQEDRIRMGINDFRALAVGETFENLGKNFKC